jgi:hypothetical protein
MAKTKAQVIAAALKDLGALAVGVSVSSEDSTDVGERFDALVTTLTQSDVVTIADPVSAIPEYLFEPLVALLVQECAPMFGAARDDDKAASAVDTLRMLARRTYTVGGTLADKLAAEALRSLKELKPGEAPSTKDATFVSDRLAEIVSTLSTLDIIAYSSPAGITAATFTDLLAYTIEVIGPKFGRATNEEARVAAENRLARITREGNTTASVAETVILEALQAVEAMGPGAAPSTKDKTYASGLLDNLLAELAANDVITIANQAAITAAQSNALILWLAQLVGPKFGKTLNPDAVKAAREQLFALGRAANTASTVADRIIAEVLLALGAIPVGTLPSTKDKTYVSGQIDNVLADFVRRDVFTTATQSAITAAQANDLTAYLIELCRSKFQAGKVGSIELMLAAETRLRVLARHALTAGATIQDEVAAQVLWQLGRVPPGGNPSALETAMVLRRLERILADLAARNVISIPDSTSIEEAHVDALSDYAAEVLAPQLAMPPRPRDPGAKREAERALRTIARIGQGTGALLTVDPALLPRRGTFNFTTGE